MRVLRAAVAPVTVRDAIMLPNRASGTNLTLADYKSKWTIRDALRCAGVFAVLPTGRGNEKDRTPPIANDAYIWQRRWNNSVARALHDSAASIRAWWVLASEVDAGGNWLEVAVNRSALRQEGKPVIAVIRIDHDGGAVLEDNIANQ